MNACGEVKIKSGAEERSEHPQGEGFVDWFDHLLMLPGSTCLKRDVLRNCKEFLWEEWKRVEPME